MSVIPSRSLPEPGTRPESVSTGKKTLLPEIRSSARRNGFSKTLADVALRAFNRIMFLKVLNCVKIETVVPVFLRAEAKYRGGFLTEQQLLQLSSRPEYELPADFLEQALSKGDECYGFMDGPVLASYGWYSHTTTATDWPGLQIRFDEDHVYMYKGFTHPAHRGQRLHAAGMTRALAEYLARGYKGIVSYVEWNNFDSLRSCYRMGYRDFGTIFAAGIAGHYVIRRSAGCQHYGFRLAQQSS